MVSASSSTVTAPASAPYAIALIGVLGAIVGALISAGTQAMSTRSSAQMQERLLKVQLDRQTQEEIRRERLRVYANFLTHMDKWLTLELYIREAAIDNRKFKTKTSEWEAYGRALRQLDLLAGEALSRRVWTFYTEQVQSLDLARKGMPAPDTASFRPVEIVEAMQAELGIIDPPLIDEATGIRLNRRKSTVSASNTAPSS